MSPLQSRLVGDLTRYIDQHEEVDWKTLHKTYGSPSQQAANRWHHGVGPTLKSLERFAAALQKELIVAIPGVSEPPGFIAPGTVDIATTLRKSPHLNGGATLHRDTRDVVEVMEGAKASDELRATIRKLVLDEVVERASRPHDADEPAGPLVRKT